ncbi:MAG: HAD family phosphatase [Bifidobacteriaceae bacterium]|nr:HAD family phosphatase [Bifidobacteriaceae bacterium]
MSDSNENTTIKSVIFDFGKVLVNWDPAAPLLSRYSDELINQFLDDSVSGFWTSNQITDKGSSIKDMIARTYKEHGQLMGEMMEWYHAHFADSLVGVVPGARQLIEDLKAAGIHVYGLSNWSPENFPLVWEKFDILHSLEDKVVSGYIDMVKPDREIFDFALNKFGATAEESVFIDDKPENVAAAAALGIHGIQQTTPQHVREELVALGVGIPAVQEA